MHLAISDWLTLAETARKLGVSEATIRRRVEAGELPCTRVGARNERIFWREDIEALAQATKAEEA